MQVLEVKGVTKKFGGHTALDEVTLNVKEHEIVGLIGPNGSGKTTLFNCIIGFLRPEKGEIKLLGRSIIGFPPHKVTFMGTARTWQIVRIFRNLTVFQNMLVGQRHNHEKIFGTLWKKSSNSVVEKALELLEFVNLSPLKNNLGQQLSYGQQKLLEFARALMSDPDIVLLDEPFAGVNPTLANEMSKYILKAKKYGKTFFVIEHNMPALMSISDRIYALAAGKIIAEGKPIEIQKNEQVIDSYFGV